MLAEHLLADPRWYAAALHALPAARRQTGADRGGATDPALTGVGRRVMFAFS